MTFRLRRGMVAETGPGWAVTGADGEPLPGRWPDEATAREQGFLGVYLMSGVDVVEIKPEHKPIRFVERTRDGSGACYWVKQGQFYLGRVIFIRPGVWMAEGHSDEFATRREAGQYLVKR